MKDFEYILEKIFSDGNVSRSEKEALNKVLDSKHYSYGQMNALRSKLFDYAAKQLDSEGDRKILKCVEEINKLLLPEQKTVPEAYACFSPGLDCLDAITREIRRAKSTIDICVFTISDNRISDEIVEAFRKGIRVRIITDNDKQYDRGSDIRMLEDKGVPLVTDSTPDHMHHKFMIVDNEILVSGSYNWTRSAATGNNENIIVMDNPVAVHAFTDEFERLWKQFS